MDIEALRARMQSIELQANALLKERDALLEQTYAACDHTMNDGKSAFMTGKHAKIPACVTTADIDECGVCTKCKLHFHRRKPEKAAVQPATKTT